MLQLFRATRRIRSATQKISSVSSTFAIILGLSLLSLAQASVYCPPGACGGINQGVNVAAGNISGVSTLAPLVAIQNIINTALGYVNILAVSVIIIAGFYLILGLGNETSKETAKKIILYTAIGIVIINLASQIVAFFNGITTGTSPTFFSIIQGMINVFTSYVALLAVAVIIIAGFYLILGLGSDTSRETARKIIIYTAIGIIVIALANVIVDFFRSINDPSVTTTIRATVTSMFVYVLNFAALITVVVIIIAGIMLIVSFGDDATKDRAKKIIIYAVIGLVVIVLARAFVEFLKGVLNA